MDNSEKQNTRLQPHFPLQACHTGVSHAQDCLHVVL